MARKRGTVEQRIEALRQRVYVLEAQASSTSARRTLAGLRAALRVMEKNRNNPEYCKHG